MHMAKNNWDIRYEIQLIYLHLYDLVVFIFETSQ